MDRERLDLWCERGILGLVVAILVFGPLAIGAVRMQEFVIIQALTLGVLVLWILRFWLNPKHRLLWPPVCWGVTLFVIYAIVRYQFADIEYVARLELIRVLIYAVLFFAILNNLYRQESVQFIALTLVFLATAISFVAVYQYFTRTEHLWSFIKPSQYRDRGSGTYICPNHYAGMLDMLIPVGLALLLTARLRTLTKVFLGYAVFVMIVGLGMSVSRGGWAATATALLVFFAILLRHRDYRFTAALLLGVLVITVAIIFVKTQPTQRRVDKLIIGGQLEDLRFMLWAPAVKMWKDHFWWGVGPGHFDHRFRQYRPAHDKMQVRPDRVHNDYLNTLTDWGVAGTSLVALAWALFYYGVFQSWKFVQRTVTDLGTKRSTRYALVLGASVGLFAILLHSVVDFNMHVPANAILAITLMALTASHSRFATESYWVSPKLAGRILATAACAGALYYLGQQGSQLYRENLWLRRATRLKGNPAERIAAMKKAFEVEPKNFETAYDLGETLRLQSWQEGGGYVNLAKEAAEWFQRSSALNPYWTRSLVGHGMCLDWIGEHAEAEPYFAQAVKLDPNWYYARAMMGWHYVQVENYSEAKLWFKRSLDMNWTTNIIAASYSEIIDRKLTEQSASKKE